MAKSRNNLLGVGGQRKKLSRADQHDNGPARQADRQATADQKQELLRKMRERAQGAEQGENGETAEPSQSGTDAQS